MMKFLIKIKLIFKTNNFSNQSSCPTSINSTMCFLFYVVSYLIVVSNTTDPLDDFFNLTTNWSSANGESSALMDPDAPQYMAYYWLTKVDQYYK